MIFYVMPPVMSCKSFCSHFARYKFSPPVLTASHGTAFASATLSADRRKMLPMASASARQPPNAKRRSHRRQNNKIRRTKVLLILFGPAAIRTRARRGLGNRRSILLSYEALPQKLYIKIYFL